MATVRTRYTQKGGHTRRGNKLWRQTGTTWLDAKQHVGPREAGEDKELPYSLWWEHGFMANSLISDFWPLQFSGGSKTRLFFRNLVLTTKNDAF